MIIVSEIMSYRTDTVQMTEESRIRRWQERRSTQEPSASEAGWAAGWCGRTSTTRISA